MNSKRESKLAIVCGASGDIGQAIALKLAEEGYDLFLHAYSNGEALDILLENLTAYPINVHMERNLDLAQSESAWRISRLVDELFPEHEIYLVNAQGKSFFGLCQLMSNAQWDDIIGVNLNSFFYTSRALLGRFIRQQSGAIVNVSSMWGVSGSCMESAYSAAKGGVIAFTKALAQELGPSHIRVNTVAPGVVDGKMNRQLGEDVLEELAGEAALGRVGRAEEIASVVRFLLSNEASFITGQCIVADGGFLHG